ncbi:serine--tRNA ligase [Thermocladium modestius]|uniref:Serine--tRNA ligase n=1 Tax=Thermocladium modestius TaxID=62609 RepID=A0A830GV69_9CREN|nr:serine--tRNA ligase [Thermocladium modestius]GGP21998.1 serine--tRNA ligase [Thermocladium modestius]
MSWSLLEELRHRPDSIRRMLQARGYDVALVDEFASLDQEWKRVKAEVDELRHRHNVLTREVSKAPPEKRAELIGEAKRLLEEIGRGEEKLKELENKRTLLLGRLPNLIHDSVYEACRAGAESTPIHYHGRPRVWREYVDQFKEKYGGVDHEVIDWKPVGHADLLENVLGLGDTQKAGEVAGSRFYYVFDDVVWLDFALILYALDFLSRKGFQLVVPPYMLKHEVISSVIDLEAFKDSIYKIEDEDLYLIGTAEHPIAAYLRNRELLESDLPILMAGFSPAFRREAGAVNRDLKGIFRVHQFHKVEQFVFSLPEESWKWHEALLGNAREIWEGLEIPFRVVLVCPGDMGRAAAKQYDLEAWMPAQGTYREMVSCSNVLDWQSAKLGIRVLRKGMNREYVHTLNSTAIASTRAITAILENNQQPDGSVVIPRVLRKYLEPFQAAPKDVIRPRRGKEGQSSSSPASSIP